MKQALENWHTWREINAQPAIWRDWGQQLLSGLSDHKNWIAQQEFDEVWLSGAGTSAYIGDIAAAGYPKAFGRPVRAVASTDIVSDPAGVVQGCKPLVVSFGRSGDSAESIGVLDALDVLAPDAPRLHITCNPDGALAQRTSSGPLLVITLPPQTHDAGFAMTSSMSTMLLTALALLSPQSPSQDHFDHLADTAAALLPKATDWADRLPVSDRLVFVGAGPLRFAAREAALKVMELTAGRIPVLWDSSLGFRHGPKSFMTQTTQAVIFRSYGPTPARYDADLAAELRAQYAPGNIHSSGPVDTDLGFETTLNDVWNSVLHIVISQVLAVVWAQKLGLNVDDPFAGQGTLTRVVSGVTLYPPEPR